MKIEMTATDEIAELDGVRCRVWKGKTEGGVECVVFVYRVGVLADKDNAQFERELQEKLPPGQYMGARWLLAGLPVFREMIFAHIHGERERQDRERPGDRGLTPFQWLAVLTEEVGEVAEAMLKAKYEGGGPDAVREETLHAAAVAVRMLELMPGSEEER